MDIYSNHQALDQLAAQYNQLEQTSADASFKACIIQSQAMQALSDRYQGNTNAKGYKKEARHWSRSTNKTSRQSQRDAEVGRWLITNGDQPHQYRTKTDIYKALHPAKPKAKKEARSQLRSTNTTPTIDPYWKDCERKYMALMDLLGDRADTLLAKALKSYQG